MSTIVELQPFLQRLKDVVHALEPHARVYLYGSRARGDAEPESDWDVLVLLDGPVSVERDQQVRSALYEAGWSDDRMVSVTILASEHWESAVMHETPFYREVAKEAILL